MPIDVQAFSAGFFLLQPRGKVGAVNHGEHLSFFHSVAGMYFERDGAGRVGVERRTDCGNDLTVRRDVPHEAATLNGRDRETRAINRSLGTRDLDDVGD